MIISFTLKARVDNILNFPGGRNNKTGEVYEPYQQAQVTYFSETKLLERKLEHSDINLPRPWGDMKDLMGKMVEFPVLISSVNWDLNVKISENAQKPKIVLDTPVTGQPGSGNGKQKPATSNV